VKLLNNSEFVAALNSSIAQAKRRALIQVMTFDGDASGLAVADLLTQAISRGVDVRLLIDCFALRYVSDRRASHHEVRAEAAETAAMFERLRQAGATVTFTQPWGPLMLFGLNRNHKKLYVIDDHAYVGGINISDHNFTWPDFMVRIEDPDVVTALTDDFASTEQGKRSSVNTHIITNRTIEPVFTKLVTEAKQSVILASPYALDIGVVNLLKNSPATSRTVITAQENNYRWLRAAEPYLWYRLSRCGVTLRTYREFFHLRFLLVDDNKLLVGSLNFNRHSLRCNQELGMLIDDPTFIVDFKSRILADVEPLNLNGLVQRRCIGRAGAWLVAHFFSGVIVRVAQWMAPFAPVIARRQNIKQRIKAEPPMPIGP